MKSKKAKDFINVNACTLSAAEFHKYGSVLSYNRCMEAIDIAEEERETAIREKAIEAFRCACYCPRKEHLNDLCEQHNECSQYKKFIVKLYQE